jgi:hypothetical protein
MRQNPGKSVVLGRSVHMKEREGLASGDLFRSEILP